MNNPSKNDGVAGGASVVIDLGFFVEELKQNWALIAFLKLVELFTCCLKLQSIFIIIF